MKMQHTHFDRLFSLHMDWNDEQYGAVTHRSCLLSESCVSRCVAVTQYFVYYSEFLFFVVCEKNWTTE